MDGELGEDQFSMGFVLQPQPAGTVRRSIPLAG